MTFEEKKIVAKFIIQYNFASYEGKIKLYKFHNNLRKRYKSLDLSGKRIDACAMKYVNEIFPLFLSAWKTEKNEVISYIKLVMRYNPPEDKLINILNKHYN